MFDFDTLETKEDLAWHNGHWYTVKLARASFGDATHRIAAGETQGDRGPLLEDVVKEKLRDTWPAPGVLSKWSQCQRARDIIRHFVLEDVVGSTEVIRFREVQRLLGALHWSSADLVRFFVGDSLHFGKADDVAREILKVLAVVDGSNDDALGFYGLFRLLETLGKGLEDFVGGFSGLDTEGQKDPTIVLVGKWLMMLRGIGSGFTGTCIYKAEHVDSHMKVAIKWPVGPEELEVMRDIQLQQPPWCLGLPDPLDWGTYGGRKYVVTELWGSRISKVLYRLDDFPFERRWQAVKVIGRLVLRRLQAVHKCGYVHCDLSPENILLGRPRTAGEERVHAVEAAPYLIDYGWAQRHPGGKPLDGDSGGLEFSSVHSAAGARRRPEDDLEALGWILVHGLFGDLPWFGLLEEAYNSKAWECSREHRMGTVKRVHEAKLQLLDDGWDAIGGEWSVLGRMPAGLALYLQLCRSDRATEQAPDYRSLARLLGGADALSLEEAEHTDLHQFQRILEHVL